MSAVAGWLHAQARRTRVLPRLTDTTPPPPPTPPAVDLSDAYAAIALSVGNQLPRRYWRFSDTAPTALRCAMTLALDTYPEIPKQFGVAQGPTTATGGTAVDFGGQGYGEAAHIAGDDLVTGAIALWVKPEAAALSGGHGIIYKGVAANDVANRGRVLIRFTAGGGVSVLWRGGLSTFIELASSDGSVVAGEWSPVVATFGVDGVELYVNGLLEDSSIIHTIGLANNSEPWTFARRLHTTPPTLSALALDETLVYPIKPTLAEIQALADYVAPVVPPAPPGVFPYGDAGPPDAGNAAIPGSNALWNPVQGINILALVPVSTSTVSTDAQLASALSSAAAGRHIVLANGTYSGNYTIYAQGTQANPIVIRPSTFLGATLTGTLTIAGSWVIVRGLNTRSVVFGKVTSPSTYRATNSRLSRCIMPSGSSLRVELGASYCCFDRNEFIGSTGTKINIRPSGGAENTFRNCLVWNLIRDNLEPTDGTRRPTVQTNTGSYSLMHLDTQLLFGWNRIQGGTNENCVQYKSAGNTAIYNTLLNTRDVTFGNRNGRRSYFGGNWCPVTGSHISLRGEGHKLHGNNARIDCKAGNIEGGSADEIFWNSSTNGTGWTFAEDASCIGNTGAINVEGPLSGLPYTPLRTLIENHTGTVTINSQARQTIDRRGEAASQVVPVAYEILANEVGPNSP